MHKKPHTEETKRKISEATKWRQNRDVKCLSTNYKKLIVEEYIFMYRDTLNKKIEIIERYIDDNNNVQEWESGIPLTQINLNDFFIRIDKL